MGHAARMGKLNYAFNILMRMPERRQLGETEGNGSELHINSNLKLKKKVCTCPEGWSHIKPCI
jgi:hypothetical protein